MSIMSQTGLADTVELILDKGVVIDAFLRVSVLSIEVLTVDARVVVAGVDTYLRFAEAANRLELGGAGQSSPLNGLLGGRPQAVGPSRSTPPPIAAPAEPVRERRS